jgi:hypothetical protein
MEQKRDPTVTEVGVEQYYKADTLCEKSGAMMS